ncbi:AAA family ATPase [Desulfobacterales bacterium HSG2]|nr:AAA family ATPase [Desulfobacterales bacterium HSG2]
MKNRREKNEPQRKGIEEKTLPVGTSDFRKLREGGYHYVDKSLFIRDIVEASSEVTLLPRPRRFGKTLNLSMLRYFLEKTDEDLSPLFDGLAIRNEASFGAHQGKYPVIWMTFKDLKEPSWEYMYRRLTNLIRDEFLRHDVLLESDLLRGPERCYFESVLEQKAELPDYGDALRYLSAYLRRYHGENVVILIDEYDTPLHAGYAGGYYKDAISFIRNFLSGGLKDNEHLFRGVLTGILRVARESVFSGLNNPGVYTVLSRKFSDAFGFTVPEVRQFLEDMGMGDQYEDVSYNGYLFGGRVIFNPWSVINYADNEGEAKPYWINTADTGMIDRLATRSGKELREEIGQLLEGGTITKPVYESIVMRDMEDRDDLLWSFLVFSGYLRPAGPGMRRNFYELEIPNEEVRIVYEEMIGRWFAEKTESNHLEEMLRALESGDVRLFERMLRLIVTRIMSYHDLAGEPEKVYHALVLGMLVWMSGKYEMRSNRESGYGRYDLMLRPKDPEGQGIIIEFKRLDDDEDEEQDADAYEDGKGKKRKKKKTPQDALKEALKQIENRGYAAELEAAGIRKILKLAVVFSGKKLWVKQGG